jgi:hypothetical protein
MAMAGVNTQQAKVASAQNKCVLLILLVLVLVLVLGFSVQCSMFDVSVLHLRLRLSHHEIGLRIDARTEAQTGIQERRTGARAQFEVILNGKRGIGVTTRNLTAKGVLHQDHRSRLPDFGLINPAKVNVNCSRFGIAEVLEFDEERLPAMKRGDWNVSVGGKMWRRHDGF